MSTQVIPYGGAELKRVMHRYWMYGFAISVVIHLGILAVQQFAKAVDQVTPLPPGNKHAGDHSVWIDLPPVIPGATTAPESGLGSGSKEEHAIPIPVKDEIADPNRTIKAQGPVGVLFDPGTGGTGVGTEPVNGGPIEVPEEAPPPFRAVEVEAKVIRSVLPVYPELARLAGLEGKVFVKVWVDKEGKGRKVELLRSTDDIFNEAAIAAAKQFLFTPAYMNNGPVSVWVAIPFVFSIRTR